MKRKRGNNDKEDGHVSAGQYTSIVNGAGNGDNDMCKEKKKEKRCRRKINERILISLM